MTKHGKIFRDGASDDQVKEIAHRLRAIDYELMDIIGNSAGAAVEAINMKPAGLLARVQRELRRLRVEMECERRFNTEPVFTPGGGPELWP